MFYGQFCNKSFYSVLVMFVSLHVALRAHQFKLFAAVSITTPEREISKNSKSIFISETREATPTKIGEHVCCINPYLHEFFEPIPID